MRSPFGFLSPRARVYALVVSFVMAAVLQYAWSALDAPLHTSAAPRGILSFETAGTLAAARAMLDSWGPDGRVRAGVNLGLDFLFIFAYSGTIALACTVLADRITRWRWVSRAGVIIAWLQVVAAASDAVETYALTRLLLGADSEGLPALARAAATPKFLLGNVGIGYVVVAALLLVVQKLRGR